MMSLWWDIDLLHYLLNIDSLNLFKKNPHLGVSLYIEFSLSSDSKLYGTYVHLY